MADKPCITRRISFQTTDGNQHDEVLADGPEGQFEAFVVAHATDDSDEGALWVAGSVRVTPGASDGGGSYDVDITQIAVDRSNVNIDVTFAVVSNQTNLRVLGLAGTTINWEVITTFMDVESP